MLKARWKWMPLALAGFALAGAPLIHAGTSDDKLVYKWVDEHGVIHYGDRVPPQYAKKEATVLNSQGVEVRRLTAERSAAELEQSEREQEQLDKQKHHDDFLLTTYASVHDIERLRDERLDQLKGQRVAAEQYIAGLQERLLVLQARAMTFRPYNSASQARRMPDDLAEQLVRTANEIHSQGNALTVRDEQESAVRAQFQADIDRYRELRTATTARSD